MSASDAREVAALVDEDRPFEASVDRAEVTALVPDAVLLTDEAVVEGRRSLRRSVRARSTEGRRLRFHQGTRIPDAAGDRGGGGAGEGPPGTAHLR